MKYLAILLTLFAINSNMQAQSKHLRHSIIPEPQVVVAGSDFAMNILENTIIIALGCEEANTANIFRDYVNSHYQFELREIVQTPEELKKISDELGPNAPVIELKISPLTEIENKPDFGYDPNDIRREGAYHLRIKKGHAMLTGANPQGLFYAMQSLIQLLPSDPTAPLANTVGDSHKGEKKYKTLPLPEIEIVDFPRFEYRGMHLDVVRHIYSVDYIKKYLDYIALHKMNYFHWHLTDDQGWRMESKKHPKLNEIGSWRAGTIIGIFPGTGFDSTRYGGYYTVEEMQEVIEYAAQRHITIVPEIDVPGHSMAILATYPQFSTTPDLPKEPATTWGMYNRQNNVLAPSEEVFEFLEDVFNEMMDVFPGEYIHIGADECAKRWWQESPETQEFIKKHELGDENGLQKYFAQRIAEIVHARGRKFIGWDEMLDDGLVDGAIVMSWRNAENGLKAAAQGHKAIMTPSLFSYFNRAQKENEDTLCHRSRVVTVEDVYTFEPIPEGTPGHIARNILGGQGCMWTEYFPHKERLEYGIFPRMSAIAEVYWTKPENKNWPKFQLKMVDQFDRYDLWDANYSSQMFNDSNFLRNRW